MTRVGQVLSSVVLLAMSLTILPAHAQLITVSSPAYRSDVNGQTAIHVSAPGYRGSLTAESWLPGGKYGFNSRVASVALDQKGEGSFTFPAERYPHGPVHVRISGTRSSDGYVDTCYLQLYNTGGVSWKEGIPSTPPPAAAAARMSLVFKDDFDTPLSISKTGEGTRYAAHKPGGGDFSQIPFGDPTAAGPFFRRDTYLIIRANALLHTTGLISSINTTQGTGFTVKAPFYAECRFIAPEAVGTWPAWWMMTDEYHGGRWGKVNDEIDIIEAYGGEGPRNPNSPNAYMVTPHTWGYRKKSGSDQSRPIAMEDYAGHSGWAQTPHTYGLLVTPTNFIFYLDDVEVMRRPSSPLAEKDPMYFMLNLAVGGSGWPIDLSRYGNVVDMYVDYIRIYR